MQTLNQSEGIEANVGHNTDLSGSSLAMERPLITNTLSVPLPTGLEKISYEVTKAANGVVNIAVDAATEIGRAIGKFAAAVQLVFNHPRAATAGVTVSVAGALAGPALTQQADGALIMNGTSFASYNSYGASMCASNGGNLVWVQANYGGTDYYFSGIRVNAHTIITAAHGFVNSAGIENSTIVQVGTGSNINSNPGVTSTISNINVFPGYLNDFNFYSPDLAVLTTTVALPGADAVFAPTSSTLVGSQLACDGFGRPAWTDMGNLPRTGDAAGFNSAVMGVVPSNVSDAYYFALGFGGSYSFITHNGRGTTGDSGGLVRDSQGRIVGMIVAGTGDFSNIGSTVALDLTRSDLQAFIPSPGTVCIFFLGGFPMLGRKRQEN